MVDEITPPETGRGTPDRTTRQAALWATVVALPVAALVAFFAFAGLSPDEPAASPTPSASAPSPQSTAPVEMAAAPLAERPATVCRALLSRLPGQLRELPQRPVTAGPEQNAAYGDPAITVTCGVPAPDVPLTDEVWRVSGVCWHAVEQPEAILLTTVDREAPVRVSVPRAYDQALQWIAPLSESVVSAVPSVPADTIPAGCTG